MDDINTLQTKTVRMDQETISNYMLFIKSLKSKDSQLKSKKQDGERYTMLTLIKRKQEQLYQFQTEQTSEQRKLSGIKKNIT